MNRTSATSLILALFSASALLLLLIALAIILIVLLRSPIMSEQPVTPLLLSQSPEAATLSTPFSIEELTGSVEMEPVFIAPQWRDRLPTASPRPTIMFIPTMTPTTEATASIALLVTPTVTTQNQATTALATTEISPTTAMITKEEPESVATRESSLAEATLPPPPAKPIDSPTALTTPISAPSVATWANITATPGLPTPQPTITPSAEPSPTVTPTPTVTLSPSPSPSPAPTLTPPPTLTPSPEPPVISFTNPTTSLPVVASADELTYEAMFQYIGAQYDIDWRLLASIAYKESSLNPLAVGKDEEMGLMQILPSTWDEFAPQVGVSDPFDPVSNVRVGAAYLAYLRDRLIAKGYPEEYWALVAYNWGPNNVARLLQKDGNWGGIPTMRQDYAYQIIEQLTQPGDYWWDVKLKELVY